MSFDNRRMLDSYQPEYSYSLTVYFPGFQKYPPPPPPPQEEEDLSLLVSTAICVIGSVLLFFFLFVFLYLFKTQPWRSSAASVAPSGSTNRREDEDEAEETDFSIDHHVWRITTRGLQRSIIDSIKVVGFKKGEGLIDGTECSVCLSEFEEDESLRLLPKCNHAFHINCIDTWLLSHKNCPLCRAPVLLTEPPPRQENHQQSSESRNDLSREGEESSGSRNSRFLPRAQSDLANHCGSGSVETVRRSFSIGGSSSLKACDGDDIATRSRRHFYSSFSANFFSSSRRSRNQDQVLPIRMPSTSD